MLARLGLVDTLDGCVAGLGDLGDAGGDAAGAAGDLGNAARHLRSGGGLFLDCGGDGGGLAVVDLRDDLADPAEYLAAMVQWAMIIIMTRRLARHYTSWSPYLSGS